MNQASTRRFLGIPRESLDTLAAVLGFTLTLAYFYPGFLSNDSVSHLEQARAGQYGNWHPPSLSLLWRVLENGPLKGPLPMLLLQAVVYWFSLWALFRAAGISARRRAWLLTLVGLAPPLFLHVGTIWKDVHLMVFLLAAFALLVTCRSGVRVRFPRLVLAGMALCYATTVRHNAIFAILPFWAFWLIRAFRWHKGPPASPIKIVRIGVISVVLTLTAHFASLQVMNWLTRPKQSYPVQQVLVHDIVGISVLKGESLLPTYLDPGHTLGASDLRRIYVPQEVVPLFCCDSSVHRLFLTERKDQIDELEARWFQVLAANPWLYIRHRLRVASYLYGFRHQVCYPFHFGIVPNSQGIHLTPNYIQRFIVRGLGSWPVHSLFFRSWFYFLLLFGLLWRGLRSGLENGGSESLLQALVLPLSGLLYLVPYVWIGTTCDYRMSLWAAAAAIVGCALVIGKESAKPLGGPIETQEDIVR